MNATNGSAIIETMNGLAENNNIGSRCCCGRPDCAYLEHNNTALGGLERDLETAARLGQALLSRHESYISESQAEHARLSAYVADLEVERTSLQSANEKIVAENRELLMQLENLNTSLVTSDEEIKRLEDLLLDCELEVKRLNGLVRRTEELDCRLQEMELERVELSKQADEGREDVRNTLVRWRESERRVRELEEDLKRIEREARLDRERHEEVVARLERERILERELGSAEGRLKGGAAIQSIKTNSSGSKNIVSHFVRDILNDNSNLQAGIAELRELLQTSNDEVQNLREQIMLHQPVDEYETEAIPLKVSSLEEQMAQSHSPPKQLQQEVHVHHHYHAKLAKKDKPIPVKRPSRKRAIMPAYNYSPDLSIPSTPVSGFQRNTTSPGPIGMYHPQPSKNRWSMQSTATNSTFLSSMPSSPRSYFDRGSMLFDRLEREEESSRPTSPESIGDSPMQWQKNTFKIGERSLGDFEEEIQEETNDMPPLEEEEEEEEGEEESVLYAECPQSVVQQEKLPKQDLTPKPSLILSSTGLGDFEPATSVVLEPRPPDKEMLHGELGTIEPLHGSVISSNGASDMPEIRPTLTRRGSHDSLVSISGMDIHIAKRQSPASTLKLLGGNSAYFAQMPSQARKPSASQALASVTEYTVLSTAGSTNNSISSQTSQRRPSGIEVLSGIAVPPLRSPSGTSPSNGGLSRLVGGWVRSKWGMAPVKSVADLRSVSASQLLTKTAGDASSADSASIGSTALDSSESTTSSIPPSSALIRPKALHTQTAPTTLEQGDSTFDMSILFAGRAPGINQPGFIPGFRAAAMSKRTPSEVQAKVIDEEGLRDCLAE